MLPLATVRLRPCPTPPNGSPEAATHPASLVTQPTTPLIELALDRKREPFARLARALAISAVLALGGQVRGSPSGAQNDVHWLGDPALEVETWSSEDGLPQNSVTGIVESRDGFLWLGTFGGLTRFDGTRFRTYKLSDTPGLTSNRVTALFEDSHGVLWIGSERNGVARMRDGVFESIPNHAALGVVNCIAEDRHGALWFGGSELGRLEGEEIESAARTPGSVQDIRVREDGSLWLGTSDGLVRLVDGRLEQFEEWSGIEANCFARDARGRSWILSGDGAYLLDEEARPHFRRFEVPDLEYVRDAALAPDQELWIAYENGLGSLRIIESPGSGLVEGVEFHQHECELEQGFRATYLDREGSLWVGSDIQGLWRIRRHPFLMLARADFDLPRAFVANFIEAGHSSAWIVFAGGALRRWDGDELSAPDFARLDTPNWNADSLCIAADGALWAGRAEEVVRIESGQSQRFAFEGEVTSNILVDAQGTAWAGSTGALLRIRDGVLESLPLPEALGPESAILGLRAAQAGPPWFFTLGAVGRIEASGELSVRAQPSGSVRDVFVDPRGSAWISTYGAGLFRLRDGELRQCGQEQGLIDDSLGGILADDSGRLWINSNRGVLFVSLEELDALAEHERADVVCRVLCTGEGNGNQRHRMADGRMWFPTITGLALVDPSAVRSSVVPPPVVIEELRYDGVRIEAPLTRPLEPGVGNLEIRYAGLSLAHPEEMRFRYRLEGYDTDWVEAGKRQTAYYTRVPPGEYRFQVVARSLEGVWNESGAAIDLTLRPHLYQSPWYLALLATVVLAGALAFHHARVSRAQRHAAELKREIKERHIAEEARRKVEESLRESSKLEAVGRLAGGIAHDFNNVLTAVLGNAELLALELQDEQQLAHVAEIQRCGERAAALTRQLLAFSRQQILSPRVLSPVAVLEELAPLLRRLLPENVKLYLDTRAAWGRIRADESQLEQVLMNLVLNARDAMPTGGTINVAIQDVDLDEGFQQSHPEAALGAHVLLSVSDTGRGIEAEALPHLFEPFFTTRAGSGGTGLGLATVHGIVKQSGGHLLVYSELDRGTSFKLYLPAVDLPADELTPAPRISRDLSGQETILLCDDYAPIRRATERVLESVGYHVLSTELPSRAVELARQQPGQIDLLLTDVVMPGMNGRELAQEVCSLRPGTRVLYMSGYTSNVLPHEELAGEGPRLLEKPFTPRALLELVRSVLDESTRPAETV